MSSGWSASYRACTRVRVRLKVGARIRVELRVGVGVRLSWVGVRVKERL